ncbi:hypothetical protein N7454_003464 [Penicillium verhagenii]|nr:hypothetical protein N7454_003464 [Penicillium verhagenii]
MDDAPPPYEAHPSAPTPAAISAPASSHPVIFQITCPRNRDYYIHASSDKTSWLRAQINWGVKSDLALYSSNAPKQELMSCIFKETTCSLDMGTFKNQLTGEKEKIWWSAGLDPNIRFLAAVEYRFKAKVENAANPFAIMTGAHCATARPFIWKSQESDWRLVDESTGNVAAVVRDVDLPVNKYGSIEILMSYGDMFSVVVFSTYLTICEKLKREMKSAKHWIR